MKNLNFDNGFFIKKQYKKYDAIKNEGEVCDSIGFILKGSIYISTILSNYSEFVITKLEENDLFGESLIFSRKNTYPGSVYASSNCTVAFIKKDKFLELISIDDYFEIYYLEYLSSIFIELQKRLKILSQPTIGEKFLYYIRIESKKKGNNFAEIKSITDVALYLNVPRPSLSRAISDLIDEGRIIKDKKKYYIKNKAR